MDLRKTLIFALTPALTMPLAGCQDWTDSLAPVEGRRLGSTVADTSYDTSDVSTAPLFDILQLEYAGAFRLPDGEYGASTFNYSEGPLEYNPDNHSIFVVGHAHHQAIAELEVPEVVASTSLADLVMAGAPRQDFVSVLDRASEGNPQSIDRIGGMEYLVGPFGPQLVVNGYEYYDAPCDNTHTTLAVRDADHLSGAEVAGYYTFEGLAHTSGWISPLPPEWQKVFGGTHITGHSSGLPIIGRLSVGPSAFVFDATDLVGSGSVPTAVPTTRLLDFTLEWPLDDDLYNESGSNDLWTHLSRAVFGFIPPGTRTYVTIGNSGGHDTGVCYKCVPAGSTTECPGYCANDVGDYHVYYWLWDVLDLVAVRDGEMAPYDVRPYDYGEWSVPFGVTAIGGGSFDPATRRLYVTLQSAERGDYLSLPVVAVYDLVGDGSVCGDGVVEGFEPCDDAGDSPTCDANCTPAACGDGYHNPAASESCDDGGETASCDADCTFAACGDGVVNSAAGERCEISNDSACPGECASCSCPVADSGSLLAHWRFDEGAGSVARDATGNGYDGAVSGASWTTGQQGGALFFDGVDDYVDVSSISSNASQITVTAWFNATSFGVSDARIISKSVGTASAQHDVMISTIDSDGMRLRVRLNTGGTTKTLIGSATLSTGCWTHVALTYDGAALSLYQDGALVGTSPMSGGIGDACTHTRIGRNPDGYGPFHGAIDDVRIYSTALDADQILAVMAGEGSPDCLDDVDCDDGNVCTDDVCTVGVCSHTDNTAPCGDGVFCDGAEVCSGGSCVSGTPIDCDDGVGCTLDACNETIDGCVHTPVNAFCDDGAFCNGAEFCNPALGCLAGPPPCADPRTCEETHDTCVECLAADDCDDGLFCTGIETCVAGACVAGAAPCPGLGCDETADACLADSAPLLAHWSFDDGTGSVAADVSGNGHDGAISGATWTAGQLGGALYFDGVDDYVDVSSISTASPQLTVTAWFNAASFGVSDARIISKSVGTAAAHHDVMISTIHTGQDTFLRLRLNTGGTTETLIGSAAIHTGRWTHVALTYDGATLTLFQDGDVVGTSSISGNVGDARPYTRIGRNPDGYGPFHGVIDDVRIYAGTLDADQIRQLMAGDPSPGCVDGGDCDDGNVCTDDLCLDGVCSNPDNAASCDNGDFCDGVEVCSAGRCVSGTPIDCDDGVGCTRDACDETADACTHTPDDALCDDGAFCNGAEACDPDLDCLAGQAPCQPGEFCEETDDVCLECLADSDCDDGDICTDDTCSAGTCSHGDNTAPCDDGLFCTATDACSHGTCVGGGDACSGQLCDETGDICVECFADSDCDDQLFCTGVESCAGGACVGGSDPCSGLGCDETADACLGVPPLAHWAFDEGTGATAFDASGNGHDAAVHGATWATGQLGGALFFDGIDDYVDLSSISSASSQITVTAWFNATSFGVSDARIISKSVGTASADHDVMISTIDHNGGMRLRVRLNAGGTTTTLFGSALITTGRWTHVALTYDGATLSLYQDGAVVGAVSISGDVGDTRPSTRIGRNPDGYGPFHGAIDDVRIYDRALDANQIFQVMAGSDAGAGDDT